jgi:hypothetical protein
MRGSSAQAGTVDLFDDSVSPINLPDMRTSNGTGQVFSAVPAEDTHDSGSDAEGKLVFFTAHGTTVSEGTLVNMTTEKGREGPFPANMYIRLLGDAGWTKGIAYPLFAKPQASIGYCSQAQKERTFCLRQTRSEIE